MKKNIIIIISCSILIMLTACDNTKTKNASEATAKEATESNEEKNLTGTFTADGKTFAGKVSVQHFETTGEYSVLCQDEAGESTLLQTTFSTEKDARTPGDLKIVYRNPIYGNKEAKSVNLSFDLTWRTTDESKGTAKVTKDGSNNVLEFTGVELFDDISHKGEKKIISGKIPF